MKAVARMLYCVLPVMLWSVCSANDTDRCEALPAQLLVNVSLLDGSGAPAAQGALRMRNGRIVAVGDLATCDSDTVVDGRGQVLAPGFIDTHSHADDDLLANRDALPVVSQGITTVVVGQDGGSPLPLAAFFAELDAEPATVNVASYAGHNSLRAQVMGEDAGRAATPGEVEAMAALLERELASGALGLSTGLEYEPGIYSATDEVLALARVAAAAGGRYISHVRSEDRWFEDAIDEILLIGRETGMPVQISHVKLAMKRLWGTAPALLAKLDAARTDGIDVTADIYPYEYWQSTMMVLLPERDPTDLEAIAAALDQIAPPEGIRMTRYEPQPDYVGKTLAEIAVLRETDPVTTFSQLATTALAWEREHGREAESIIGTSMVAADIDALFAWPWTNVCTDGGIVDRHPRARGAFPRVLGRYVREQHLVSLAEAVRKMTSLPAHSMGLADRGLLRPGMVADLVLFDPDTVIDRATPVAPEQLSVGITTVWVAGEPVYADGAVTAARPGNVLRRAGAGR